MRDELLSDATKIVWIGATTRKPWHLAGPNAGAEGVVWGMNPKGHTFAPHDLLFDEGARQDGATFRRAVVNKRIMDFEVSIGNDVGLPIQSYRHWQAVHDLWWRDWSKRTPGILCFWTKGKGWKRVPLLLGGAPEPLSGIDPAVNWSEQYTMDAVGPDPFYYSLQREVRWVNTSGSNEGVLKMRNDASEPAWGRFTLKGSGTGTTGARYFIQDFDPNGDPNEVRLLQIPPVYDNETLQIDTHPRNRTARVYNPSGVLLRNVWGQMGGRKILNPIPPWGTTEITVMVEHGTLTSEVVGTLDPISSRPL